MTQQFRLQDVTLFLLNFSTVEGVTTISFFLSTVNDIRGKLYMVGTYSTVKKRAKRMPDPTVETTNSHH